MNMRISQHASRILRLDRALSMVIAISSSAVMTGVLITGAFAQTDDVQRSRDQQTNACILVGNCNQSNQNNVRQPPPKPDVWGAIAVSPAISPPGYSYQWKTEQAARNAALQNCSSKGGRNCKVIVTFADICAALAVSQPEKVQIVGGPTGAANFAANNAMLKCQRAGGRSCTIAISFCADGVNHNLRGETVFSNGNPIFVPQGQGLPFGRRR
jgi:Domain of unknown function (DUF4189)